MAGYPRFAVIRSAPFVSFRTSIMVAPVRPETLEPSREVQSSALDLVKAVRSPSLYVGGQYMVARHVLRVSEIDSNIPLGKDVSPLRSQTSVERIGGCCQVVACHAGKDAERQMVAVA